MSNFWFHFWHAIGKLLSRPGELIVPGFILAAYVYAAWGRLRFNFLSSSAKDWAVVPARIDIASAHLVSDSEKSNVSEAVLTYFYRYPELEMGDFRKTFSDPIEAKLWAEEYKGRTVMVRVNPRKVSESVLSEEDLQHLNEKKISHFSEEQVKAEMLKSLPPISWRIQVLTVLLIAMGMAGTLYTLISIGYTLAHPGQQFQKDRIVASGVAAFVFYLMYILHFTWINQIDSDDHIIVGMQARFTPRWLRSLVAGIFLTGYLISILLNVSEDLPPGLLTLLHQMRDPIFEFFGISWCLMTTISNIALHSVIQAANRLRETNT